MMIGTLCDTEKMRCQLKTSPSDRKLQIFHLYTACLFHVAVYHALFDTPYTRAWRQIKFLFFFSFFYFSSNKLSTNINATPTFSKKKINATPSHQSKVEVRDLICFCLE